MENINPLFMLQPVIVVAFSAALMVYWYKKRHFHKNVWLYSLIAYAIAIALKVCCTTAHIRVSFRRK
jgi:hypothetical protein